MPEVSVIVPVYKVEKYLHRCIDSILAQTFEDFELILVDDGSPDNCGVICDEYAEKDCRVKVIHKENGGVSSARNAGLVLSTGEYIMFCDGDDALHQKAVECLLHNISTHSSELIVGAFEYIRISSARNTIKQEKSLYREGKEIELTNPDGIGWLWEQNNMLSACGKIFRGDIIRQNELCFNTDLIVLEDYAFVIDYLFCCQSVAMVPDVVYLCYPQEDIPLLERRSRKDFYDDVLVVSRKLTKFLSNLQSGEAVRIQEMSIYPTIKLAYGLLWSTEAPNLSARIKKYKRIKKAMSAVEFGQIVQYYQSEYTPVEYVCLKHRCLFGLLVVRVIRRFF